MIIYFFLYLWLIDPVKWGKGGLILENFSIGLKLKKKKRCSGEWFTTFFWISEPKWKTFWNLATFNRAFRGLYIHGVCIRYCICLKIYFFRNILQPSWHWNHIISHFKGHSSQDVDTSSSSTSAHISSLPMEVLIHILKWVVSSELDLKSLENFSQVCRGFYVAARASDIWRRVCIQTWVAGLPIEEPSLG